MIVVDTNVVSEVMRRAPSPMVVRWLDQERPSEVWLTSMTVAELLAGVATMPDGARKKALSVRMQTLLGEVFAGRVLDFDGRAAVEYARLLQLRRAAGLPISTSDAVIASTVLGAGISRFATRNTADFAGVGLTLVDPWRDRAG